MSREQDHLGLGLFPDELMNVYLFRGRSFEEHRAIYGFIKEAENQTLKLKVSFSSSAAPNVDDHFPLAQELMVKIFKILLKNQPPLEHFYNLTQLAEVCERWRQIILQEITLWDNFELLEWAEENVGKFLTEGYQRDRYTYAQGRVINLDSKVKKSLYDTNRITYLEKPIHPFSIGGSEFSLALSKKRVTIVRPRLPSEILYAEYSEYKLQMLEIGT